MKKLRLKNKTKKHLKHVKHVVTKKKLLKKKAAHKLARAFFISVAALCTGSLAIALAATNPAKSRLQAQLVPGTRLNVPASPSTSQTGTASWYALGLPAPDALTCASTTFGRGTYLLVKNLRNGKTVTCLVNDYGPEAWTHRVIDLSRGSFRVIDSLSSGTAPVEIHVVSGPPQGLNIPVGQLLGQVMGYSLCRTLHNANYCEINRQTTSTLR